MDPGTELSVEDLEQNEEFLWEYWDSLHKEPVNLEQRKVRSIGAEFRFHQWLRTSRSDGGFTRVPQVRVIVNAPPEADFVAVVLVGVDFSLVLTATLLQRYRRELVTLEGPDLGHDLFALEDDEDYVTVSVVFLQTKIADHAATMEWFLAHAHKQDLVDSHDTISCLVGLADDSEALLCLYETDLESLKEELCTYGVD